MQLLIHAKFAHELKYYPITSRNFVPFIAFTSGDKYAPFTTPSSVYQKAKF